MNKFYVAYGSNLNVKQMATRCPGAEPIGTAFLYDHRLTFKGHRNGTYGVLTVDPRKGYDVPVAVWKLQPGNETSLDQYEGFPHLYRKEYHDLVVRLFDTGEELLLPCMLYRMTPGHHLALPTQRYFETCRTGYQDFGFDQDYLLGACWASKRRA